MSKKIVFMGTPEFAVPTLEALKNSNTESVIKFKEILEKIING